MTYTESHRREKQSFWNGILVGSVVWVCVALVIVWAFEAMCG